MARCLSGVAAISVAIAILIPGCSRTSKPVPPATVQKDVSQARQAAAENDASAARELANADRNQADAAYQASITEAEGQQKVALAKCEGLGGNAQSACKDQADANFELAKAKAEAAKAGRH